jgi:hypothetical protein
VQGVQSPYLPENISESFGKEILLKYANKSSLSDSRQSNGVDVPESGGKHEYDIDAQGSI